MAIKFLSGLNLSNVTAGSILKLDSNGNIVAATAGTDYATTAGLWTTAGTGGVNINKDVRIGTYSSDVLPEARLHVYEYQTTDPKILIEDGNTGDASMQFKISTQSYTMGIDNSDSDKFVFAASTALGTTNVLEVSTAGATAFQKDVIFNEDVFFANDVNFDASGYNFTMSSDTTNRTTLAWRINSVDSWEFETSSSKDLKLNRNSNNTTGDLYLGSDTRITGNLTVNTSNLSNTITAGHSGTLNLIDTKTLLLDDSFGTGDGRVFGVLQPAPFKPSDIVLSDSSVASDAVSNSVTNTFPNVKGEADATGITNNATFTFAEALAQAETLGGRLPTLEEVLNGVGNGSGQGYDAEYIWTQTKAGHGKYWVAKGHGINSNDAIVVDTNASTPPEYSMRIFYDISKDNMPVYYDNSSNIRTTSIKAENSDGIALRALDGDIALTIKDDATVKLNQYTAGLLKTDATGNISLDTSTYLTSVNVDWSDIASINGTININSTTQIGEGDTETLVSFQNSGTERGSFEVDSSANSYFVATGFKTATASTGFLKADGTVDTDDFFSGSYSDLSGTPTLGTMAAAATSDYKTSDQTETYVDTELGSYTATTAFGTNAFTSFSDHSTQGYLTSYTEADTLDSVTGRGATTTNNISVGNLTAVGGTFTDPVTIYDSTTTENPRLSVGRNAGESIQFGVTDVVNTITAKQDSDSNGDHFFVLDRVFAGTGDSTFRIQNDGTPDLTIDGSGVVSLNQYNTAGILKVNTSGTISVDTNTYSTATGVADNADNYSSWTVSDGTNTESITSGTTVAWRGSGATSVSYDSSTNQFSISSTNTQYSAATTSAAGLMSSTDKTKLDGIATGAEVNVQSDWNATTGDAFIQNKPTLGTAAAAATGDFATAAQGTTADAALPKAGGTMTGALTINQNGDAINLRSTTNGQPSRITFSSDVPADQIGYIEYSHVNTASYGSGESFVIGGNQADITILADGKLMYNEGIYSKPSSGTGAGTRKDANWDTAYGWGDHGLSAQDKIDIGNLSGTNTGDQDLSGYSTTSHNHDTRYPRGITKSYSSVDVDSDDDAWYKIFQTTDSGSTPVECHVRGYAHSSISFIVSEGYLGSGGHVQVLDYCLSTNNNYKWIKGVRIISNGDVELLLQGGSTVSLEMTVIGDASVVSQPELSSAASNTVKDTVVNPTTGMLRAKGVISGSNFSGSSSGTNTGDQVLPTLTSLGAAPLASPALTGTPTAPTAGATVNTTQLATTAFVQTAIANLSDSAPATLNTLNELAAALGDDASFSTTVTTSIAAKLPLAGGTMTGALTISAAANAAWLASITNTSASGHGLIIQAGGTTGTRYITQWKDAAGTERFHMDDTGEAYFQNTITASGGINGLTLANGGISGTNYNITGVNQLEIADPGEGIVFKSGSSGDMTLAIADDTADNILRFSGTNAVFDVAGDLSSTSLVIADSIIHEGDTNTSISFGTDTINLNTGGGSRINITDSNTKVNNDLILAGGETFSLGQRAEGDDNGRTVLIEGIAEGSAGEGSGRIFFSEHNATDAAADKYGLSLYYEGNPNAQLPSGFQPNTGNGTWSLRRHNNSTSGAAIMSGDRTTNNVTFSGTITVAGRMYVSTVDANATSTTALVLGTSNEIEKRTLGSNAFNSIAYLEDISPATPSVDSATVVGETIEIAFSQSSTPGVDYYQVWSAVGSGGSYGMIAHVPQEDVASSMTVIDATFDVSDTMYYKVYAVKSGIYSTAGTINRAFSSAALDVSNMSVVNLNTAYYIQYEMPDSRFVDHVEIYMDAEASAASLTRTGATLVYSGNNTSYMYKIGANDLDKYHQFWVEVIES